MKIRDAKGIEFLEAARPPKRQGVKDQIIAYINGNPGCDLKILAKVFGRRQSSMSTYLLGYAKRGHVIRRRLDGRWRYYAQNYVIPEGKREQHVRVPELAFHEEIGPEVKFHAKTLEQIAMKWAWEHESDSLRGFITDYKQK